LAGQVNLAFATEELRDRCEILLIGERAYGPEVARQLRERLASMREADNVFELLTGHPRPIPEGDGRCYEVLLPENVRMVICANHKVVPRLRGSDSVDWSKVTRVIVQSIEKAEAAHGE
jgi:hypothetical protein